jgi:hypothetical protein
MKKHSGIATGGERRLREAAIEAQVRREFDYELSAARELSQQVAIEEKIQHELKERMKQSASPQSMWSSK